MRHDLQGLRGLGVTLVVIGHLWRWPSGVFAALDIFFVLSGFLITGILVDNLGRHGRKFLLPFYAGRLRRLAPTAIAVVVVTVIAFSLLVSLERGRDAWVDGRWALLFMANWHFAAEGTDYFAESEDSPFLHYWSLSVEEQFYAGWPLLILATLFLASRRHPRQQRILVVICLTIVTTASFAYSMYHSSAAPAQAYFSTFDRAWEFGAGGLLAMGRCKFEQWSPRLGALLSWAGVTGLLVTIFVLERGSSFPAPWALPAVLLSCFVIAGGGAAARSNVMMRHLANRPLVYLGTISYSIYLWHLPTNVLLRPFFPSVGTWYYVSALTLTACASVLSYYLIERPLRRAPCLLTPRERRRVYARRVVRQKSPAVEGAWWSMAVLGTAGLCLLALMPAAPPATSNNFLLGSGSKQRVLQSDDATDAHQDRLIAALNSKAFPEFSPSLSDIGRHYWGRDHLRQGCVEVLPEALEECYFGRASDRIAVVFGDSFAVAWMPAIRGALTRRGWAVQQLTLPLCPSWTLPSYVKEDLSPFPECAAHHRLAEEYVRDVKPDLLILASAPGQVRHAERDELSTTPVGIAERGLSAAVRAFAPFKGEIVVIAPPPLLGNLRTCVTRLLGPETCVRSPTLEWEAHVAGESAVSEQLGLTYVETENWFCVDQHCPAFMDVTPVTSDGAHLTVEFARQLAPLLGEALDEILWVPRTAVRARAGFA